ncbi:predicted protein [Plenodomus lingam JN3]|uniref:Predicted protein n=1 Tax=Leptosphaeria maculans (strain JN3 / isolate v23.1.3 / race Av1-4-5-6-7-8) TaxID=985895 RepID=E5AED6_LEPMJ|nr:predicted protein [Plenodomus lingam JN3]CBY01575.1 predicted protein [Plenodomus lingam JN3]
MFFVSALHDTTVDAQWYHMTRMAPSLDDDGWSTLVESDSVVCGVRGRRSAWLLNESTSVFSPSPISQVPIPRVNPCGTGMAVRSWPHLYRTTGQPSFLPSNNVRCDDGLWTMAAGCSVPLSLIMQGCQSRLNDKYYDELNSPGPDSTFQHWHYPTTVLAAHPHASIQRHNAPLSLQILLDPARKSNGKPSSLSATDGILPGYDSPHPFGRHPALPILSIMTAFATLTEAYRQPLYRGVDYEADVDWLRNQGSRGRRTLARETYRLHHFYQRAIDSDAVMQEEHAPSTEIDTHSNTADAFAQGAPTSSGELPGPNVVLGSYSPNHLDVIPVSSTAAVA